jgi:hypothetical protein
VITGYGDYLGRSGVRHNFVALVLEVLCNSDIPGDRWFSVLATIWLLVVPSR